MARRSVISPIAGAACGLALALAADAAATAQVLEIQPDGAVVTYAGPAVYSSDGVRPIGNVSPPVAVGPAEVSQAIRQSAARHALPPALVEAVAWQESRLNPAAVSPKGARGVMQLMPDTARSLGVDAADVAGNIEGGAAYLALMMRRFGELPLALAAYNAGPEAVARYGAVPPYAETRNYVRAILGRLALPSAAALRQVNP